MSDTATDEVLDEEEKNTQSEPHIPKVAKKVSKFGNMGGMSKFGKGAMGFNPPNKQRPGRAAGRGR